MLELDTQPHDRSQTEQSDQSNQGSGSKEKLPARRYHYHVVMSGNEPKAFVHIERVFSPILRLPGISFEEVCQYVDKTIDKNQYKIHVEENSISYHHQEHSAPLSFIQISSSEPGTQVRLGLTFDKDEQKQRIFFLGLANHLFKDAKIVPIEEWDILTISDLEFLSQMSSTAIDEVEDDMERKLDKTLVAVPKEDDDMAYVLNLVGLENIEGEIYFALSSSSQVAGVKFVKKTPVPVCFFPARRFHEQNHAERKWAIASSIGWLLRGKDFRFKPKKYNDKRRISDMALGYFTYSSDPNWDPREYEVESLEEHFRAPISLLSLIWELPAEKRCGVVLALWQEDFGDADFKKAVRFVKSKLS